MSVQEIEVAGTLKPDDTLELDQRPNLPPGRVTVVLRQESEAAPWKCCRDLGQNATEPGGGAPIV
jgi:hypothetical protein